MQNKKNNEEQKRMGQPTPRKRMADPNLEKEFPTPTPRKKNHEGRRVAFFVVV